MFELFGLIFGGVSRLTQHWMEMRDKDKERGHEAVMFDKQVELADKRHVHDRELRTMDAQSADAAAEWEAMRAAIEAQSREAAAAGGWVAKLSASIRPGVTVWLLALYSLAKVATLLMSIGPEVTFAAAVQAAYTQYDGMLLNSVLSFWFADRSLRKR